jgi:cytochrome c
MSTLHKISKVFAVIAFASAWFASSSAFAFDAATAEATARKYGCFKCHSLDKKKDGPPYREVAARYKGKSDAEARLHKHITSGVMAKFPDGHEEEHKVIKTKDADEIMNLIQWILSLSDR